METFSALLAICEGNSPVPGKFPSQRPVTRSFDIFFDLHLNKRLSKQSWGWLFETPQLPLWRDSNDIRVTPHEHHDVANHSNSAVCSTEIRITGHFMRENTSDRWVGQKVSVMRKVFPYHAISNDDGIIAQLSNESCSPVILGHKSSWEQLITTLTFPTTPCHWNS